MKRYYVTYREEWGAEVKAANEEEAIEKFKEPETKKEVLFDLWYEFFEVEEIETRDTIEDKE